MIAEAEVGLIQEAEVTHVVDEAAVEVARNLIYC